MPAGIYIYRNNEKFGPYSTDQISTGLNQRTFLPTDLAWQEGMPGWEPLSTLLPAGGGGASCFSQQHLHTAAPTFQPPGHSDTSRLALASLIIGIVILGLSIPLLILAFAGRHMVLLFFPLLTIAAIILGHIARGAIRRDSAHLTGGKIALTGTSLGYTGIAITTILLAIYLSAPHPLTRQEKRDFAERTMQELRMLDSAIDAYTQYSRKPAGEPITPEDLREFLKPGSAFYTTLADPMGHPFGPFRTATLPKVPPQTYESLSDIADSTFWSPYY